MENHLSGFLNSRRVWAHASECGRQLGTQRDFAFTFVCEIEKFIDISARSFFLYNSVGSRTGPSLPQAVAACDFAPGAKMQFRARIDLEGNHENR